MWLQELGVVCFCDPWWNTPWCIRCVFVILAFIQPQVKVLPRPEGSKGLLVDQLHPQGKLAFTSRGCGERFPASDLEALMVWGRGCACLRDGRGVEMCQLCKSFQQGSPEALQQPWLRAGHGRLAGICLHLLGLLLARPGILLLLPGTWRVLKVFLCSARSCAWL